MDATLVDGGQERTDGSRLRHACHLADVGTVVTVVTVYGMVHHQQVTVAAVVGIVAAYALTMTVDGMAVDAR